MAIISRSCATLDLSCPTSEVSGATLMEEMDGDATPITLSARVASASKGMSPEEARIIRTCPGSRCRKNSLRNVCQGWVRLRHPVTAAIVAGVGRGYGRPVLSL